MLNKNLPLKNDISDMKYIRYFNNNNLLLIEKLNSIHNTKDFKSINSMETNISNISNDKKEMNKNQFVKKIQFLLDNKNSAKSSFFEKNKQFGYIYKTLNDRKKIIFNKNYPSSLFVSQSSSYRSQNNTLDKGLLNTLKITPLNKNESSPKGKEWLLKKIDDIFDFLKDPHYISSGHIKNNMLLNSIKENRLNINKQEKSVLNNNPLLNNYNKRKKKILLSNYFSPFIYNTKVPISSPRKVLLSPSLATNADNSISFNKLKAAHPSVEFSHNIKSTLPLLQLPYPMQGEANNLLSNILPLDNKIKNTKGMIAEFKNDLKIDGKKITTENYFTKTILIQNFLENLVTSFSSPTSLDPNSVKEIKSEFPNNSKDIHMNAALTLSFQSQVQKIAKTIKLFSPHISSLLIPRTLNNELFSKSNSKLGPLNSKETSIILYKILKIILNNIITLKKRWKVNIERSLSLRKNKKLQRRLRRKEKRRNERIIINNIFKLYSKSTMIKVLPFNLFNTINVNTKDKIKKYAATLLTFKKQSLTPLSITLPWSLSWNQEIDSSKNRGISHLSQNSISLPTGQREGLGLIGQEQEKVEVREIGKSPSSTSIQASWKELDIIRREARLSLQNKFREYSNKTFILENNPVNLSGRNRMEIRNKEMENKNIINGGQFSEYVFLISFIKKMLIEMQNSNSLPTTLISHSAKDIKVGMAKDKNKMIYHNIIKGFIGKSNYSQTQLLYNSKSIIYSFDKFNNYYNLIASSKIIESILKNVFLSLSSIISKPIFSIKQDKIIIRLFLYLSPKIDRKLTSSLNNKRAWRDLSLIQSLFNINKHTPQTNILESISTVKSPLINDPKIIKTTGSYPLSKGSTNLSYFSKFQKALIKLSEILESIFNKKIEFEIIKLQFPFHDSHILAQILGYNANRYKFHRMINKIIPKAVIKNPSVDISYAEKKKEETLESKKNRSLFKPSSYLPPLFSLSKLDNTAPATLVTVPLSTRHKISSKKMAYTSFLSGINVKLAGRLMTQGIRPRFSVETIQNGSLSRFKVDYIEKSRFTGKNKRGAFSFTVVLSHIVKS
jgi:Mitochondrial ribosomal protein (VAR1)